MRYIKRLKSAFKSLRIDLLFYRVGFSAYPYFFISKCRMMSESSYKIIGIN